MKIVCRCFQNRCKPNTWIPATQMGSPKSTAGPQLLPSPVLQSPEKKTSRQEIARSLALSLNSEFLVSIFNKQFILKRKMWFIIKKQNSQKEPISEIIQKSQLVERNFKAAVINMPKGMKKSGSWVNQNEMLTKIKTISKRNQNENCRSKAYIWSHNS